MSRKLQSVLLIAAVLLVQLSFKHQAVNCDAEHESNAKNLIPERSSDKQQTTKTYDQLYSSTRSYCNNSNYGLESDTQNGHSIAQVGKILLNSRIESTLDSILLLHRYDNPQDLKVSGGPQANHKECIRQLRQMERRGRLIFEKNGGFHSKDSNLFQLFDTYGRVASGFLLGNTIWPGLYHECLRLKMFDLDNGGVPLPTRYCLASLRYKSWPKVNSLKDELATFRSGICIPKACDSSKDDEKYQLILRSIEYHALNSERRQTFVSDLYCLPDEQSPLRQWHNSPKVLAFLGALTLWLLVLGYATYRYETAVSETKFSSSLALTSNLRRLFSGTVDATASINTDTCESFDWMNMDGIKVFAVAFIIFGQTIASLNSVFANPRTATSETILTYEIGNMLPETAVNSLFAISGILISYTVFACDKFRSSITNPVKWLMLIVHKYLRMMPLIALVVLYSKTLAKYTGSGPLWDYGISAFSQRRGCEEESWKWTLLMASNLKPTQCNPLAWILASEFQFLLVTPIFLVALHRVPWFGKLLLIASTTLSYLMSVFNAIAIETGNLLPIVAHAPYAQATLESNMNASHVMTHQRIGSYLVGIFAGYQLYLFKQQQYMESPQIASRLARQKRGLSFCFALFLFSFMGLALGRTNPRTEHSSKMMIAILAPLWNLATGASTSLFVLLAASTSSAHNHRLNRMLSSRVWSPLAKVSLSCLLISHEVIEYNVQTLLSLPMLTNRALTISYIIYLTLCYVISVCVYLLVEAPVREIVDEIFDMIRRLRYQPVARREPLAKNSLKEK